jgi:hypothetical protein
LGNIILFATYGLSLAPTGVRCISQKSYLGISTPISCMGSRKCFSLSPSFSSLLSCYTKFLY